MSEGRSRRRGSSRAHSHRSATAAHDYDVRPDLQHAGLPGRQPRGARRREGRQPQRRRDLRLRPLARHAADRGRIRRPLRAPRLPARSRAPQPVARRLRGAVADTRITAHGCPAHGGTRAPRNSSPAIMPGPWLPPERTFAPLGGPDSGVPRRARALRRRHPRARVRRRLRGRRAALLPERRRPAGDDVRTGTRRMARSPSATTTSAPRASVDADGWAFRIAHATDRKRVRGSVDYSVANAHWLQRGDDDLAVVRARRLASRARAHSRHHHDRSRRTSRKRRRGCSCSTRSTRLHAIEHVAERARPRRRASTCR